MKRRPREVNRTERLLAAMDAKAECDDLLYGAQALILCGLPYAPTAERTIVREAQTSRGRLKVTFSDGRYQRAGQQRTTIARAT